MNKIFEIGFIIKKLRQEKCISQKSLATQIGCTQSFICKLEQGAADVSLNILSKISVVLGLTVTELLDLANFFYSDDLKSFISDVALYKRNDDYKLLNHILKLNKFQEFLKITHIKKIYLRMQGLCAFNNIDEENYLDKTFKYLNESINVFGKSLEDFNQNSITHMAIGDYYFFLGQYDNSMKHYEKSQEILKKTAIKSDYEVSIQFLFKMSILHVKKKNYRKSARVISEAIKINVECNSAYIMGELLLQKAIVCNLLREKKNARSAFESAKAIFNTYENVGENSDPELIKKIITLNCTSIWFINDKSIIDSYLEDALKMYKNIKPSKVKISG